MTIRTLWVALRAMLLFTLVLGVGYTLVVTGVGQLGFTAKANGSLLVRDGEPVGSALIGQSFDGHDEYFQSRPSAAGDGYDAGASGGSNLGPEHPDLIAAIRDRRAAIAAREGVPAADVPADAVTASGSGLDPHISPEYARLQVPRVAAARGIDEGEVERLVSAHTIARDLGVLGSPVVNVLELNLALDAADGR